MDARTLVALLLLAVLALFVGMNLETARVWLFGVRAEMPIGVVVLVSGALGMGAGLLFSFVRKGRKKVARPPV